MKCWHSPILTSHAAIRHSFFGKQGGVSEGNFASLNCGLSNADVPQAVQENRRRAVNVLGVMYNQKKNDALVPLLTPYQVHSADVFTVLSPFAPQDRPRADALVTKEKGLAVGVVTADCAPLLFYDNQAQVIGAAHSGWKGTLGQIASNTLEAMENLGANRQRIYVAIGPCISKDSYEVSADFLLPFLAKSATYRQFFTPSPTKTSHFQFDLKGMILFDLLQNGLTLEQIDVLAEDTYTLADDFFSNRRAFHKKESGFGLQLSAIALV